jgi:hypothetical protein
MATKKETTPASEKKTTVKKATTEPKTSAATAARKTKAAPKDTPQAAPAAEARVPAKAAKPAASGKASEKPSAALTRVLAYVDVGHGNTLFLRGEGPGLSWETGVPMQWIGDGCWSWSAESAGQDVTFKVLINDQHWSGGDNRTVAPGETASFTPTF